MIRKNEKLGRSVVAASAILCMVLASAQAGAGTAVEERIIREPMPHTQLSGGASVKVHYSRLHFGAQGEANKKSSQALAKSIKSAVAMCVEARSRQGSPVNPPREFPTYTTGVHEDLYVAPNYHIVYRRQYAAHMRDDCSLKEGEVHTATLESHHGACEIDLKERTAQGECDLVLHAAALTPRHPPLNQGMQQQIAMLKANPRMAAAAAHLEKLTGAGGPTGVSKRVLGIECVETKGAKPGESSCIASEGSFRGFSDLYLERHSGGELVSSAVQAKLDTKVSTAVFAPHQAGGFRISARPAR